MISHKTIVGTVKALAIALMADDMIKNVRLFKLESAS